MVFWLFMIFDIIFSRYTLHAQVMCLLLFSQRSNKQKIRWFECRIDWKKLTARKQLLLAILHSDYKNSSQWTTTNIIFHSLSRVFLNKEIVGNKLLIFNWSVSCTVRKVIFYNCSVYYFFVLEPEAKRDNIFWHAWNVSKATIGAKTEFSAIYWENHQLMLDQNYKLISLI